MDLTSSLGLLQYQQGELVGAWHSFRFSSYQLDSCCGGRNQTPVFPSEAIGFLNPHKRRWLGCLAHHFLKLVIASWVRAFVSLPLIKQNSRNCVCS